MRYDMRQDLTLADPKKTGTTADHGAMFWTSWNIGDEREMKPDHATPTTVDEYIAGFPPEIRSILRKIRETIKRAAPETTERISYNMPAFSLGRDIVYFGAFKNHIGLFPPVRDPELEEPTLAYRGEKGNLRFPLDRPIPYALIGRIVTARVSEIRKNQAAKRKGRQGD